MTVTAEFITVGKIKTHYYKLGSGCPLILVHPFLADASTWMGVNEFFAQKFTVYAPDLPGFGKTEIGDTDLSLKGYGAFITEFIKNLKLKEDFILCGISMGGTIVTYARPQVDENVTLYLLLEPLFAWHFSRLSLLSKCVIIALTAVGMIPLSPKFFDKIMHSDRWLTSVLSFFNRQKMRNAKKAAQLLERYRICDFEVFHKILESIMTVDLANESFITSQKTLLVMSTYDETLDTKKTVDGYKTLYPNLQYENLPLPHDPMKPVTKDFLNEHFAELLEMIYSMSKK